MVVMHVVVMVHVVMVMHVVMRTGRGRGGPQADERHDGGGGDR